MQQELEIEVKALVNKEDFKKLCHHFQKGKSDFKTQVNYYFDDHQQTILKQHGSSLRVRKANDEFHLTLKVKAIDYVKELDYQINKAEFEELNTNPHKWNSYFSEQFKIWKFAPQTIEYIASLSTKRVSFPFEKGELFLDINHYQGMIDYEVEYETSSYEYGEQVLQQLFQSLEIPLSFNHVSKRERALKKG